MLNTAHRIVDAISCLFARLYRAIGLVPPLSRFARTIASRKVTTRCAVLFITASVMTSGCKSFDCPTCPDSKNNGVPISPMVAATAGQIQTSCEWSADGREIKRLLPVQPVDDSAGFAAKENANGGTDLVM
jgi:hypothetical protein